METPQRSYAWDGDRMPHHQSSADGETSTSGRSNAERPGSANLNLRSVAHLPRSSRNGSESPTSHPAADLVMQDGQASLCGTGLRARPPSSLERGVNATSAGRKARRGSIADFLGIRTAAGSQELSPAPSRDITLHGMAAAAPPLARRSRRASVMQTFGFGSAPLGLEGAETEPQEAQQLQSGLGARSKSLGAVPRGRRRRASMLDLFRPTTADTSVEGADDAAASRQLQSIQSKSSVKSRRASVIDFFRSSNTGIAGTEETVGGASMGRQSRQMRPDGLVSSRSQRRRSVIDILGQSSKKVFAKLMNQDFEDEMHEEDAGDEGKLWFTSLNDFKPLTFKYLTGRYTSAFFACSVKTGQHYILKQFEKGKMSLTDERGVRRALAFAHMLDHEHIVQCCGTWEDEQALYIVEEYATKGDLLQDSMSHPEKYTEAFMATKVVKPLLEVLVYLHNMNVVHRAIFPEYVMFGREDKLKLGHFTSAIDQRLDHPTERIPFLDYMAPEMLSVQVDEPATYPGAGTPQVTTQPPWAGLNSRTKLLGPQQARITRGLAPSFDGSPGSQQQQLQQQQSSSLRATASMLPPSPPSSRDPSPFDRRSPLISPATIRRAASTTADLGGLFGAPLDPGPEPVDRSPPVSRGNSRSPLNLFRGMRRLSPHQLPDEELAAASTTSQGSPYSGSGGGGGRRAFRGSDAADAPWLLPAEGSVRPGGIGAGGAFLATAGPPRRRKSVVDEMSAPWLRPVDAGPSSDMDAGREATEAGSRDRADGHDGFWRGADNAVEAMDRGGVDAAAATASGGQPSGCIGPAVSDGEGPQPPSPSSGARDALKPESSTITVVQLERGAVGQLSDPQVERLSYGSTRSSSDEGSGGAAASLRRLPSTPPSPLPYGGSAAAAVVAETGSSPPPRPMSSRRPGSALLRPGSAAPRRASSLLRGDTSPLQERKPSLPDRDECLPGYAAEPPPPTPPLPTLSRQASSSIRPQTARRQSVEYPPPTPPTLLRQTSSVPAVVSHLRPQTARRQGSGPMPAAAPAGPVSESLLLDPPTFAPASPYDAGADAGDAKRGRTAVSFTNTIGTGEESAAADERPSGRASRTRIVSREASATSSSGQVISGLRIMARNITARLGQVLGARASEASIGPNGEVLSSEVEQGLGPGSAAEPTPRPSQAGGCGGADATALFMPNNPWEWQEHYNEKVDLWQVGCLVHEILCLSLPFETDDKMLACALILWADITSFPDHLSPECHDFIRTCLTKNPAERPSAAELLQHPWVVRHAAGEVLKSVREQKEAENPTGLPNGQHSTTLQRAAAAVGLGWLVGAGGTGTAAGGTGAAARGGGGGGWLGSLGWLLRPWTSKVAPARAEPDGEAKFEMAMAMVQEHQAAEIRRRSSEVTTQRALESDRSGRRRSLDVESGGRRHSLESVRQYQQHNQQHQQNQQQQGGAGGSVGSLHQDSSTRWGVML